MGIQITGLASGLNWQNLVTTLVNADRAPEIQWKSQQTNNTSQISSLATLKTDLQSFQSAAEALATGTAFSARSASVANTASGWSANATSGTATGQYSVTVSALASTAIRSGSTYVGGPISSSSDVSGVTVGTMNTAKTVTAGIFTVDGAQVTIAQSDSLQDVFDKIATATGNAVTASYDSTSDTIKLASSSEITLGAGNDTSNFLSATRLFNNGTGAIASSSPIGSVGLNATIASSGLKNSITDVDSTGSGAFSINGVSIAFNVNTDTLQTIMGRINNAGAGVTATFNGSSSQFTLTNNSTGDTGISVSESAGGLMAAMGLGSASTFTRGSNAEFSINGNGPFTSSTNSLDASEDGISGLTVNATSLGTQTVTVGNDTSGVSSQINDLVNAYNTVQAFIDSQTATTTNADGSVTTSILTGNHDVTDLSTNLENLMFNTISGMTGSIHSLDSIGIGFTGTSPLLSITDQSQLDDAVSNNTDSVNQLFNNYPNGLVAQINAFVNNATSSSGVIATETDTLSTENKSITTQISTLETQLAQEQSALTSEFTAMETAMSQYQSQAATLTAILNGGTASSGTSSSSSTSSSQQSAFSNANTSSTST